jgi:hypothetical protein
VRQSGQPRALLLAPRPPPPLHGRQLPPPANACMHAAKAVALSTLMNQRQSFGDWRQHLSANSRNPEVTRGSPPVLMK